MASRFGKMPTTTVRRLSSRLSRSWGWFDQICRQPPRRVGREQPYRLSGAHHPPRVVETLGVLQLLVDLAQLRLREPSRLVRSSLPPTRMWTARARNRYSTPGCGSGVPKTVQGQLLERHPNSRTATLAALGAVATLNSPLQPIPSKREAGELQLPCPRASRRTCALPLMARSGARRDARRSTVRPAPYAAPSSRRGRDERRPSHPPIAARATTIGVKCRYDHP